jgi:hypothetical protein
MPEESTPPVVPAAEPPATPPAEPPAAAVVAALQQPVYFGNDGTLNENWQSTLPEGYRDEPSLKTVKHTGTLARMFVDTKRMVGMDKVAVPTDASTEVEWEAYHKAGGRPETVEDYNLKIPDGIDEKIAETYFPKERIAKWQERFFKGGTSKKAADLYMAAFVEDIMADLKVVQQDEQLRAEELVRGLNADWGAAYEQNKHLGNIAIEEGCSVKQGDKMVVNQEFKVRIVEKFGTEPDFIRFASNLGKKFAEGKSPEFSNVPTPSDLQAQINELMASPVLVDPKSTWAQRKLIMDKIMAIRAKIPA